MEAWKGGTWRGGRQDARQQSDCDCLTAEVCIAGQGPPCHICDKALYRRIYIVDGRHQSGPVTLLVTQFAPEVLMADPTEAGTVLSVPLRVCCFMSPSLYCLFQYGDKIT